MTKKKWKIFILLLAFAMILPGYGKAMDFVSANTPSMTMVVDPGHGGMDGGASAADGTLEQALNLAIAKAVKKEGEKYGVHVVLTREDENGLYYEGENPGRWTKVGDMKERKRIMDEIDPDITLSIHLNNFLSDTGVCGAQVFYPDIGEQSLKEENLALAEALQKAMNQEVNAGKDRIVLPKSGIYLFRDVKKPILLVECGFLSNPTDAENLKTEEYQRKIAWVIMETIAKQYGLKAQKSQNTRIVEGRTKRE